MSEIPDSFHRRELARAESELDAAATDRFSFIQAHETPYTDEEQQELNELNGFCLVAIDRYYQVKYKK